MISLRNVEKVFLAGHDEELCAAAHRSRHQARRVRLDHGAVRRRQVTLLHIIGMHDHSWHGEYHFDDVAVHSLKPKQRGELRNRNIGFVFQSYHLLDDQTVFENLELPLSYRDVSRKDRQSIVCDTLDRFQIVGKKDLYPTSAVGWPATTGRNRARSRR